MVQINLNLVFTIINLLILYLLMKKFLFGPIIKVMDQRKAMIDQQFQTAKETEDKANELKQHYEDALKSAKEESWQIVEQAKQEAKARADQSAREAEARTEAMLAGAREDIRNERENAMKQMQSEIGRLAIEAAAKIMESERSSDKDLALYDQFIKKAGDSDDDNSH